MKKNILWFLGGIVLTIIIWCILLRYGEEYSLPDIITEFLWKENEEKNNEEENNREQIEYQMDNHEEVKEDTIKETIDDVFPMKEKCYKYQKDVNDNIEKLGYSTAHVFYSKLYNSCLVEASVLKESESVGWIDTSDIFDLFNGEYILSCIMYDDYNMNDVLIYDYDKFDLSFFEGQHGECNIIRDIIFDIVQNPDSENGKLYLKSNA